MVDAATSTVLGVTGNAAANQSSSGQNSGELDAVVKGKKARIACSVVAFAVVEVKLHHNFVSLNIYVRFTNCR